MKKRALALTICLLFVVSLLPVTAFAAIGDDYPYKNACSGCHDDDVSPWKFYYRQCTDFVAWRLNNSNGVSFHNNYGGVRWGNASNWGNAARDCGITVNNTPAVGAVAWWSSGTYGHVAWVSAVNGNSVEIEEYNYGSPVYNCRTISAGNPSGYIHIKDLGSTPTPTFTPVDIGTGFYGSIVNLSANKPIKVSNGNVVMGVRNGSNEQKWKFERQSDTSYKIINVATGLCIDDDNYGTTDNTNIKAIGSNDETAQRWYFRKNGNGYSLVPKCAMNLAMDMTDGNSTEGHNVAAWTYVDNNPNQIFGIDIQPSFEPVDVGSTFYGSIVNLASNKPIKVDKGNVVMGVRNSGDEQKWKFERMDDRMYKITNVATGLCIDDDNYGTTDNTNIKAIGSNDETAQRWYFRKNGNGYSLVPKCAMNLAMDMTDGDSTEGHNIAAWTYVDNNPNQIFVIDNLQSLEPVNLGDDFYATILNTKLWKPISLNPKTHTVTLETEQSVANQKWRFVRQSDGSYVISSCFDGNALEMTAGLTTNGTQLSATVPDWGADYQRWYLYEQGNGYVIQSKHYFQNNWVMDLRGAVSIEDGASIDIYSRHSGDNQIFSVYKGDDIQLAGVTLEASINDNYVSFSFDKTKARGAKSFNLKIWKDQLHKGDAYYIGNEIESGCIVQLEKGTYYAYVDSVDYYHYEMSNVVTFTVEKSILPTKPTQPTNENLTETTKQKTSQKVIKKANPLKVKVSSKTFKRSKLKKAVKFALGVSKAQGPVTYTLDKIAKKAGIKVTKKGKVLIPKKCKKGTYKITVKASGNKNYKAGTKIVKIKVK